MRTSLKVCCISSWTEAQLAIRYGANALGLVGDMPSGPGIIDDELAREIARATPPTVDTFLLTSHERAEDIADHVQFCGTTTVQVVRHIEPSEYVGLARRLPTTRFFQVIHVEDEGAFELLRAYAPYVHGFLLDSGRPSAPIAELGGTGRSHDWQISSEIVRTTTKPVFLAGGLHAANVRQALAVVRPFGVDLCSGVRTDDRLDEAKLRDFTTNLW